MGNEKFLCLHCNKVEVSTPYSDCNECRLLCGRCRENKHNGRGVCDKCEKELYEEEMEFNSARVCPFCEGKVESYEHYNGLYDELHWSCEKCEKEFSCDEFLKLEIYVDGACDFCKEKAKEYGAVKVICSHKY